MPLPFASQGRLIHLTGKTARAVATCSADDWLVMNGPAPPGLPCKVFDSASLRQSGAVAVYLEEGRPVIRTVKEGRHRLWDGIRKPDRAARPVAAINRSGSGPQGGPAP